MNEDRVVAEPVLSVTVKSLMDHYGFSELEAKGLLAKKEIYRAGWQNGWNDRDISDSAPSGDAVRWHGLSEDIAWLDGRDVVLRAYDMEVSARYCPGEWSGETPERPPEYDGPVWSCFDDKFQIEIEECSKNPREWCHNGATHWREALTAPGASVGENSSDVGRELTSEEYTLVMKSMGEASDVLYTPVTVRSHTVPSDPTPQDAKDVRPAPNTEAGMMYEEEMLKGRIKMSIPAQDAKADALTKWQQEDIAEWAKRWHWHDCEENHADPSVYPRDLRLLAAFRKVFLPPSASKPITVDEIAPPEWLWWGEVDGNDVVTFGRWPKHGAKWRYKLAEIQPTEHDHPRACHPATVEEIARIARNELTLLDLGLGDEVNILDCIAKYRREKDVANAEKLIGDVSSYIATAILALINARTSGVE